MKSVKGTRKPVVRVYRHDAVKGFPSSIAINGWPVLMLVRESGRNTACAPLVAKVLRKASAADLKDIMRAAMKSFGYVNTRIQKPAIVIYRHGTRSACPYGIAIGGWVVLQLVEGTTRNNACAPLVAKVLRKASAADLKRIVNAARKESNWMGN